MSTITVTTIATTSEDLVRLHDENLHRLIANNYTLIPNFLRTKEIESRWGSSCCVKTVWDRIVDELESLGNFSDVVAVLNTPSRHFNILPRAELRDFVETFPTLVWTLLLQTSQGRHSAFRLLLAADRLDFVESGLQVMRTNTKRGGIAYRVAERRVWPGALTTHILCECTSAAQAQQLYTQCNHQTRDRLVVNYEEELWVVLLGF